MPVSSRKPFHGRDPPSHEDRDRRSTENTGVVHWLTRKVPPKTATPARRWGRRPLILPPWQPAILITMDDLETAVPLNAAFEAAGFSTAMFSSLDDARAAVRRENPTS